MPTEPNPIAPEQQPQPAPDENRYWAFISYSHHDKQWANWLHREIERYGIPSKYINHNTPAGEPAPRRFRPIFRDREELPASHDLGTEIEKALHASNYLIVVCSPRAAQSKWVNKEIETFRQAGRDHHILAIIVDGEPRSGGDTECFPPALLEVEPIAADARDSSDGKENAKLKLIAGMLGVGFDHLKQRHAHQKIRNLQKWLAFATAGAIAFAALGIYSYLQRNAAIDARDLADIRRIEADEARAAEKAQREIADANAHAERERAEELELVVAFQEDQLAGIDTQMMGIRLRHSLLDEARTTAERAGWEEEDIEQRLATLDESLAGANFTDVALRSMDENIFQRALTVIEEQFSDRPLLKARLLQTVAHTCRELGLLATASSTQHEALDLRKLHLGALHHRYLHSLNMMSILLRRQGRLDEALKAATEAYTAQKAHLGENDVDTLASLNSIALTLHNMGRHEDAVEHYRKCLDQRRTIDPECTDADTLTVMNNLGSLLSDLGEFEEAEELLIQTLKTRESILPEGHPHIITSMSNLGELYYNLGNSELAEKYWETCLKLRRMILGDDHPDTVFAITNMAHLRAIQERHDEALDLYEEAQTIAGQVFGAHHLEAMKSCYSLGMCYYTLRQDREALPHLIAAHEWCKQHPGEEVRIHLLSLYVIPEMYLGMHEYAKAAPYAESCYEANLAVYGEFHSETTDAIYLVVNIYTAWHEAEPDAGHDARSAYWHEVLAEAQQQAEEGADE